MKKNKVLPLLACTGIAKNKELYLPYLGAGVFSSFLYFTFTSILYHPIMGTLPRAEYAYVMLMLGFILLNIIVLPFLHYTYRFVIKRRKRELGLYSILGLEKKHIAVMMFYESIITTGIIILGGVLFGVVFAKLIFMLLFYMIKLPVLNEFPFSFKALQITVVFFLVSALFNLAFSLYAVGRSNPIELFAGSRRGEKKPRFLWLLAVSGMIILGAGYFLSITAEMDQMIFVNFFLAVFLVVIGTYFIFTSGSVIALKMLKKRKSFYYKPSNFITVSGMYYRMKRNAAGLVNICIFSTMIIITLSCTVSLYMGMGDVIEFQNPYDIRLDFQSDELEADKRAAEAAIYKLKTECGIAKIDMICYKHKSLLVRMEDGKMESSDDLRIWEKNVYNIEFVTLEEYNQAMGENKTLEDKELFLYCDGQDYNGASLSILGEDFAIKEMLTTFPGSLKKQENTYNLDFWVVMKDYNVFPEGFSSRFGKETLRIYIDLTGDQEAKSVFAEKLCDHFPIVGYKNNVERRLDMGAMYGGLLFLGIFFGLLFMICLVVIMYYKQITEGHEDRDNFDIMQKVGMSHQEVRHTIAKQVLLVFFLPIFGAVCHTMAAIPMTTLLLSAIALFDKGLIIKCSCGVLIVFFGIYGLSYLITARAYLRIVEKRGN